MNLSTRRLVPLFLLVSAMSAAAQVKVEGDKEQADTLKITITGGLSIDYVFRDEPLSLARGTFGTSASSEGVIHGHGWVRLEAELTDKIRIVMRLDNKRLEGSSTPGNVDVLGSNPEGLDLFIREAHITVAEFLDPAVSVRVGVIAWSFMARETGGALFFDPAHSANLTANAINSVDPASVVGETAGGASLMVRDELQPAGALVTWSGESFRIDALLLPAIIEGGSATADEAAYGIDAWYIFQGR